MSILSCLELTHHGILVYPQVFSTYVYTYVALHICHCLKCMLLPKNTIYDYKKSKTM